MTNNMDVVDSIPPPWTARVPAASAFLPRATSAAPHRRELQATVLVHEAYLRLTDGTQVTGKTACASLPGLFRLSDITWTVGAPRASP